MIQQIGGDIKQLFDCKSENELLELHRHLVGESRKIQLAIHDEKLKTFSIGFEEKSFDECRTYQF